MVVEHIAEDCSRKLRDLLEKPSNSRYAGNRFNNCHFCRPFICIDRVQTTVLPVAVNMLGIPAETARKGFLPGSTASIQAPSRAQGGRGHGKSIQPGAHRGGVPAGTRSGVASESFKLGSSHPGEACRFRTCRQYPKVPAILPLTCGAAVGAGPYVAPAVLPRRPALQRWRAGRWWELVHPRQMV